jgi:hypothetical protein
MRQARTYRAPHRWRLLKSLVAAIAMCAVAVMLAGCGTGTSTSTQSFPTATTIPATPGTTQLNGCAAQQSPTAAKKADVIAQGGGETAHTSGQPVTLHTGQTLQVRLSAAFHWRLAVEDIASVLQQPTGNGWLDTSLKACVWQFTAAKVGHASLVFGGGQVCSSSSKCPNIVLEQSFSITVK